jgi:hypothetical protein
MSSGRCAEERRAEGFVPFFTALTNSEIFELTAVPARRDQSGLWPALNDGRAESCRPPLLMVLSTASMAFARLQQ